MPRPLTVMVILSVAAHAALLLSWTGHTSRFTVASSETAPSQFHVAMINTTVTPPIPQNHRNAVNTFKTPDTVITPLAVTEFAATHDSAPAFAESTLSAPASAQITDDVLRNKVLHQVKTNFSNYFYYPMLARRNGWQGHVLLGFAVEADGAITHAHVAHGSGFPLLDESALAALQQVRNLPNSTSWLNGSRIELKLPVEYRLTGG